MIDPAYLEAAKAAKARAEREGRVITHMVWRNGHLDVVTEARIRNESVPNPQLL